jgi:hypothetical protein
MAEVINDSLFLQESGGRMALVASSINIQTRSFTETTVRNLSKYRD